MIPILLALFAAATVAFAFLTASASVQSYTSNTILVSWTYKGTPPGGTFHIDIEKDGSLVQQVSAITGSSYVWNCPDDLVSSGGTAHTYDFTISDTGTGLQTILASLTVNTL